MGHTLALGDAGDQCLNGGHELIGIDAKLSEGGPIGQDSGVLLDLPAFKLRGGFLHRTV
ncbi:hypothetical protein SDC9_201965 [bioreactor metagenome]|uniref:Uncharacterized protein n=1 Tax=bioreactor metagenome TaxID=1076179 RepID=A0A645ISC3_9ZZZZ